MKIFTIKHPVDQKKSLDVNATNFGKSSGPVGYLDIVGRYGDAHWELGDVKTREVSLSEPKEVLLEQNFVCKMGVVTLDDYVPSPLRAFTFLIT